MKINVTKEVYVTVDCEKILDRYIEGNDIGKTDQIYADDVVSDIFYDLEWYKDILPKNIYYILEESDYDTFEYGLLQDINPVVEKYNTKVKNSVYTKYIFPTWSKFISDKTTLVDWYVTDNNIRITLVTPDLNNLNSYIEGLCLDRVSIVPRDGEYRIEIEYETDQDKSSNN